jgi:hypothetical protein
MGARRKSAGKTAEMPGQRPLRRLARAAVLERLQAALQARDGLAAAHCIHELWMRNELSPNIEAWLAQLWSVAADSVPDWLPMRYVEWLPIAYDVAARFQREGRGRSNLYLVLLDYGDSSGSPYGVYVGVSRYKPAERFDQHKAGIRAAGSVLKRGLELLVGPVLHLQGIPRAQAAAIEATLAEALRAEGLRVKGGH